VIKHFIYVHYGCGKQLKVDYSLNHDIMASFEKNTLFSTGPPSYGEIASHPTKDLVEFVPVPEIALYYNAMRK
jgi:hypothetical protein